MEIKRSKESELDCDHLPKYVIAKINKERGIIDFGKRFYVEGDDIVPESWHIMLFSTPEEANGALISGGFEELMFSVRHLDELHLEFAKFITSGESK